MSNKKRKGSGDSVVTLEHARRQLAKGDTRQALKDAKLLFRRQPTDAHRNLLEQAYAARVEQLQKMGLPEQARAAYDELQSLPPRSPDVLARLERLQMLVGVAAGGRPPALEALDPDFLTGLADDTLLHPQRVATGYSELLAQGRQVRKALEAIERGDDSAASALLQNIPQKSPFAEWKLLARGLSAHYAGDGARRDQNWDRMNPRRAPFRIAQTLRVAWGLKPPQEGGFDTAGRLRRLEFASSEDVALRHLKELAEHLQKRRWRPLLRGFRTFAMRFAASHGELIERITQVLWISLARGGHNGLLRELISFARPPALDPHWHRALALCAEADERAWQEDVEEHWKAYLADLPQIVALRDSERNIAAALVNLRLAAQCIAGARHAEERASKYDADSTETDEFFDDAEAYFQAALDQYPQLHGAYVGLAALHWKRERPERAVPVFEALLKYHPDDWDALTWLANYFVEDDQPDKAEPYVQTAMRLRPRDRETQVLLWNQRLGMVRYYTRKRKFDRARQEIETLAAQPFAAEEPWWMDATRAAVEFKARNPEQAQVYLDRAIGRLEEPTPIWLVMHALAVRYRLDKTLKNDFANRFKAAVRGRCNGQTAGQMARFLSGYLVRRVRYTGFVTHQRALRKYLERCGRVTWTAADLLHVCRYLSQDSGYWRAKRLLEDFADEGCSLFPRDPHFPYYAGLAQIERGPWGCDVAEGISAFETALKLNELAESRLDAAELESLKEHLSFLRDQREHRYGPPGFYDEEDDDDEYYDEDDEDEDEDDDEFDGRYLDELGGDVPSPEDLERAFADPELRKILEQIARAQGIDPQEALAFARRFFATGRAAEEDASPAGHGRSATRRRKKK